jgi:hypothetical protein
VTFHVVGSSTEKEEKKKKRRRQPAVKPEVMELC